MNKTNELITLTRIDETTLYVNPNHISTFYYSKSWEYTIVLLVDGTQLDVKDSVESIAKYF
ncbi:putative swarming motility protein [Enterococcus phage 9184]|uniref:Putative swarming motility protein n=1 Tax=Enterococcus phage 9184 TaxID=2763103 RepID=A0A7L8ZIW4_9CAUD|nr:putative swarming motility protein [Enterococcus phage 9184]